jgi:uncharacterized protein (DUF697 family)
MPTSSKRSRFGKIGTVKNFINVVREVDFDAVRTQAELPPRILVIAETTERAGQVAEALVGESRSPSVYTATYDHHPSSATPYDAIVVHDPGVMDKAGAIARSIRATELDIPMVRISAADPYDAGAASEARNTIVRKIPERAPAIARHLPMFRSAAVRAIIDETAVVNAKFSLISNAPAAIPVIGAFAAAGADMLVLTKNQVMMLLKIAACHDRDLRDHRKILQEIAPVVGLGFLWRTVAREAASFLPLLLGTVPKVGIAYAGTMAAGFGADFYYRFGKKATREQMRNVYKQAAESIKRLPLPMRGDSADDAA